MEIKEVVLIVLGALGWFWAVIQFFLNRKNQKRDKAIEKRFEVYSSYLRKTDEIMENMRSDPKMIYGLTFDFMKKIMNGTEEEIDQALLDFNSGLVEFTKKSVQPIMILNQELNNLKLVCSDGMLPKIEEYKKLANDFVNDFQLVMNALSSNPDETVKQLETIGHDKRTEKLVSLNNDIQSMMRKEIDYYNK